MYITQKDFSKVWLLSSPFPDIKDVDTNLMFELLLGWLTWVLVWEVEGVVLMKFSNCNGGISSGTSGDQKKTILSSSTVAGYIVVRSVLNTYFSQQFTIILSIGEVFIFEDYWNLSLITCITVSVYRVFSNIFWYCKGIVKLLW